MKKLLASFALGLIFLAPSYANAQTVDVSTFTQEQRDALLVELMQKLVEILQELQELKTAQARTEAKVDNTPVVGADTEEVVEEEFEVDIAVTVTGERDEDGRVRVLWNITGDDAKVRLTMSRVNGSTYLDTRYLSGDTDLEPGNWEWKLIAEGGDETLEKTGSFTVSQ